MTIIRPQTLGVPTPPGSLLKRLHGIRRIRAIESERDEAYLRQVRELPCLKCGMEPCGEASHTRLQSAAHGTKGGLRKLPADKWALPLDGACHRTDRDALHQIGEDLFWHILGINPLLVCEQLYAQRGDLVAMRAVVLRAIAERG
jgi:hypothetical protein